MFFLVCKLYKLGLYITTYFGHGQCFIWGFLVLAFIETAILNTTSFRNFSWSGNDIFWSVNYICQVCKLKLVLKVLDNVFIHRFLLVAFVKYTLSQIYSHCTQNCTFFDIYRLWKLLFSKENIFNIFLCLCFFIQKPVTSITQEWLVVECCLMPQWKIILMFCRLFYNIHSFKWHDIGLKCLLTITPKGQSLKFKASIWNIPISKTGRNCNSLFKLVDSNLVVIMEQKRRMEYNWTCTVRSSQGFSRF